MATWAVTFEMPARISDRTYTTEVRVAAETRGEAIEKASESMRAVADGMAISAERIDR